jgi:frataxin-like iron-binding protein CyaY
MVLLPYKQEFDYCATLLEKKYSNFDFDEDLDRITIHTPCGILLVNWHGVAKEIWVSSPLTGAHHFCFKDDLWKNTRDDIDFRQQLEKELDVLK